MKISKKLLMGMLALSVISSNAFATGSGGMVWEKPSSSIAKSISGPVAGVVALVVVIVAAFAWAMTDGGNMMGKCIRIVAALAIVGGAATFISAVFNISTAGGMMI
jgi:trbC/VIRB2 family